MGFQLESPFLLLLIMNKFQPFHYHTFEDVFINIEDNEKEIVLFLREFILNNAPNIREKLSYNVPFYFLNRSICYIWPGSIPWGSKKKSGVEFGITKGYKLNDKNEYLEKGNRKQIYYKVFHTIDEIDIEILQDLLNQAVEIDKIKKTTNSAKQQK
jgi:hypothetical protein